MKCSGCDNRIAQKYRGEERGKSVPNDRKYFEHLLM